MIRMLNLEKPCGIFVVNLAQNLVRQTDAIDAPTSLRWNFRRSIVKILVFCLEKTVIDFVKFVVEYLLRKFVAMRRGVGREQDAVLVLVEKLLRCVRLASELSDPSRHVHVHVRKAVEVLGNVLQI